MPNLLILYSLQLLTYELKQWGHQTCLSLAVIVNNKQFLAHPWWVTVDHSVPEFDQSSSEFDQSTPEVNVSLMDHIPIFSPFQLSNSAR